MKCNNNNKKQQLVNKIWAHVNIVGSWLKFQTAIVCVCVNLFMIARLICTCIQSHDHSCLLDAYGFVYYVYTFVFVGLTLLWDVWRISCKVRHVSVHLSTSVRSGNGRWLGLYSVLTLRLSVLCWIYWYILGLCLTARSSSTKGSVWSIVQATLTIGLYDTIPGPPSIVGL